MFPCVCIKICLEFTYVKTVFLTRPTHSHAFFIKKGKIKYMKALLFYRRYKMMNSILANYSLINLQNANLLGILDTLYVYQSCSFQFRANFPILLYFPSVTCRVKIISIMYLNSRVYR